MTVSRVSATVIWEGRSVGFRFRRTVIIAPGVRLNVGKKSMSVRMGGRGFGVTVGTTGARVSAGIPGTGIYMTQRLSPAKSVQRRTTEPVRVMKPSSPEPGTKAPIGWVVAAIIFALIAFSGELVAVPAALVAALMAWRGYKAPRYVALKRIQAARKRAETKPSKADREVRAAAELAPDSWTVQSEAASYFVARNDAVSALEYFTNAIPLFPGDRRGILLEACEVAMGAEQYTWVIETLEPRVASMRPDDSDLDALLLTTFALAQFWVGQAGIALELTKRLPLRRRNLTPPLLFGLCVRALAKHASGQKASAQRDLERVYAIDPGFPFLKRTQELITEETTT